MGLTDLVRLSRHYGQDSEFVLAGGGNTSYKEGNLLYVKASGTTLAETTTEGMVRMDRSRLNAIWEREYSHDQNEREREVLADLMAAREAGETGRPSVETLLHSLLRQHYVVHLHPALINGLTCGRSGREIAAKIFPRRMLWIPVVNPGYVLARHIRDGIEDHLKAGNEYPQVLLLQNHGVFVACDSVEEIELVYGDMMNRLTERLRRTPDVTPITGQSNERLEEVAQAVREISAQRGLARDLHWEALDNREAHARVGSSEDFEALLSFGYTPDHLVYCGAAPVWLSTESSRGRMRAQVVERVESFMETYRQVPRIIALEGEGIIALGDSEQVLTSASELFVDLLKVVTYAESFGGPQLMTRDKIDFILNWEAENYRAKVGRNEG